VDHRRGNYYTSRLIGELNIHITNIGLYYYLCTFSPLWWLTVMAECTSERLVKKLREI